MSNYWDYSKLLEIVAIVCLKFYNVYNSINLDYCFAYLLLQFIVIIVIIANIFLGLSLDG